VPAKDSESLVGRLVQALWFFHNHVFIELNDAGLARHASEVFCIRKGIVEKIPSETVNDDAYIAVVARKKGWLIKYEPRASVSISGPKTLIDYIRQRRRIIFGHYQIRKLTGETPQYLVHLAPQHPRKVFQLALWLCAQSGVPTFFVFSEIELLLNASAILDLLLGKNYARWSIAASTKVVPREQKHN
jgi:cellulose synthase/poly-beta-1,6-N-acetylglucosamine synthase-like glycosyltransferase